MSTSHYDNYYDTFSPLLTSLLSSPLILFSFFLQRVNLGGDFELTDQFGEELELTDAFGREIEIGF